VVEQLLAGIDRGESHDRAVEDGDDVAGCRRADEERQALVRGVQHGQPRHRRRAGLLDDRRDVPDVGRRGSPDLESSHAWDRNVASGPACQDGPSRTTAHVERGGPVATEVCAEMVANVVTIVVAIGSEVAASDTLLILESMKMEIPVLAENGGTVVEIRVTEGDVVQEGDVLVVLA
jgi:acetyl-CoA carboxylase biotin carboxyl carrier protein